MDLTRRDFLSGGAALGGLMATSALPALVDDPSVSAMGSDPIAYGQPRMAVDQI